MRFRAGCLSNINMINNRDQDLVKSMRTNFHGPLNITRSILPMLREKGNATLLYVSSQAAWHGDPSAAAYCASKAALEGKNLFIYLFIHSFFYFFFSLLSLFIIAADTRGYTQERSNVSPKSWRYLLPRLKS